MDDLSRWTYYTRKVEFNDSVVVHNIPNDEDRSMTWLYDRKRFERRIVRLEPILKPILIRHLASMKDGARG